MSKTMKKMKRIIALITVAMFVLSFAAPVFAADATPAASVIVGKDVVGTKYEKDSKILIALDIIKGFPDGSIKPESTVTRAQFAAIVANELGIGEGAAQAPTKFTDVPSSHWASGLVNLAVGRGIIKGYGDGTFKPEKPVTYAEAYAMLVQMLGYGPALQGASWPAGVVAKAASLGVSKGVTGGSNAAMTRGNIITAAVNSLDIDLMEQDTYGTDNNFAKQEGKTLLTEVFDITIKDAGTEKVTDVPMVNISGLDADEVKIASTTYTISPVWNANAFLGQKVEYWVDGDDEIFYIGGIDDQEVINDKIDSVSAGRIYLDAADDDYAIDAAAKIWVNIDEENETYNTAGYTDADLNALADANVKVVLEDDKVVAAVITDFSAGTVGVAKSVDAEDENIKMYTGAGSAVPLEDFDYVIVKDGMNAKLADIKDGDVVNVLEDVANDEKYVAVTSKQVKGTATISWTSTGASITNYKVAIDGVKYAVDSRAKYSDDANDSISGLSTTDIKDLNGEAVTLYLDAKGEVAHVVSGSVEASSKLYGIISKSAVYSSFDDEVKFNMVNMSGTEATYRFDPSDVDLNGAEVAGANWVAALDLTAGDNFIAVQYKLDSAGKLTKVDVLGAPFLATVGSIDANEDDKTITLTTGDFKVNDKTIIMDCTEVGVANAADNEYDDIAKVTWDAIKTKTNMTAFVQTDGSEVEYLFITNSGSGSLTSDKLYGVVTGFGQVSGDDAVNLLLPDGTVASTVYTGNLAALAKGQFVTYDLNSDNEIDTIDVLANASTASFSATADMDYAAYGNAVDFSSGESIEVGGVLYSVNDATKIFNVYDTDKLKVGSSVSDNDNVIVIDTDDDNRTVDYIVVVQH